jgi:hypothetical protein
LKNQKADIRILLRSADKYAVAFYAKVQSYNLYCGPGLGFGPKGMFRYSYHESGESHLHVPKSEGLGMAIGDPGTLLAELKGKQRFPGPSSEPQALKWDARPKPDSSKRRTIIMDLEAITVPSFSIDLWTLEPGKPELVEEALQFYEPFTGVMLAHVLADWCTPNLLGVVWTLRPEAWANLERSIATRSG